MASKKIFILMGNPDSETVSNDFANAYEAEAKAVGHDVRRTNLIDMHFDPLLHKGYKVIQELEPDLRTFQENLKWAEHFVLIYPVWWSGMPSLLKALFERMWLPAFAFHFWPNGLGWDQLMKGKTARLITLSKMHPFFIHLMSGDHTSALRNGILRFSGYRVALTEVGGSETLTEEKKAYWIRRVQRLARKGR
ncbi:MAG: NAD(P)H-dependent oxidoreductase [Patescibacteria group bacterium]